MTTGQGEAELRRRLAVERRRAVQWQRAHEGLAGRRSIRLARWLSEAVARLVGRQVTDCRPPAPPGESPDAYRGRLGAALGGRDELRVALGPGAEHLQGVWPAHASVSAQLPAAGSADLLVLGGRSLPGRLPGRPVRVGLGEPGADTAGELDLRVPTGADAAATARAVIEGVRGWLAAPRFALAVGAPAGEAEQWGDVHLARSLRAELRRRGYPTRLQLLDDWYGPAAGRDDVRVHLFGRSELVVHPEQTSVMWHISHPDRLSASQADAFHLVAVASQEHAEDLATRLRAPVIPLPQAADTTRFEPTPGGPRHEVLFVGNTRGAKRRAIQDLLPNRYDVAVYGAGWEATDLPARVWRGTHLPNDDLPAYYTAADVVVADHWEDMRRHGFISNRVYEVLACGTAVVCDDVPGLDEALDGVVPTYRSAGELRSSVDELLADAGRRERIAEEGRSLVLARHTMADRVEALLGWLRDHDLLDGPPG